MPLQSTASGILTDPPRRSRDRYTLAMPVRRTNRVGWSIPMLLLGAVAWCSGCAKQTPEPASFRIPAAEYAIYFDAARQTLQEYQFDIDRVDARDHDPAGRRIGLGHAVDRSRFEFRSGHHRPDPSQPAAREGELLTRGRCHECRSLHRSGFGGPAILRGNDRGLHQRAAGRGLSARPSGFPGVDPFEFVRQRSAGLPDRGGAVADPHGWSGSGVGRTHGPVFSPDCPKPLNNQFAANEHPYSGVFGCKYP